MRELEIPCPDGCGGSWRQPAAEAGRVVDAPSDAPMRVRGHTDAANEIGADFVKQFLNRDNDQR